VAEADGRMLGFFTVDPRTFDIDQTVVAPEAWGLGVAAALIAEAKRISPAGPDLPVNKDNARAIRFFEKQGFVISGEALNWRAGARVHRMSGRRWAPARGRSAPKQRPWGPSAAAGRQVWNCSRASRA